MKLAWHLTGDHDAAKNFCPVQTGAWSLTALMRIFHTLPKPTAHGVPALAGQTRFRPRSREELNRLQEAAPRRLKPGLHALKKAAMVVQPCVSSFRLAVALVWLAAASLQAATLYEVSQRHPQAS